MAEESGTYPHHMQPMMKWKTRHGRSLEAVLRAWQEDEQRMKSPFLLNRFSVEVNVNGSRQTMSACSPSRRGGRVGCTGGGAAPHPVFFPSIFLRCLLPDSHFEINSFKMDEPPPIMDEEVCPMSMDKLGMCVEIVCIS